MNTILSLQLLDASIETEGDEESAKSICCYGSTGSVRDCCNTAVE